MTLVAMRRRVATGRFPVSGGPPAGIVRLDEVASRAAPDGVVVTAPQPVLVRGDEAALERAIRNLIENALLHGPAGGAVAVALEERAGRALLTASGAAPRRPAGPARASDWRSCAARPSGTAVPPASEVGGSRSTCPSPGDSQGALKVGGYNPDAAGNGRP